MPLREFLAAPENTAARQRIIFDRICFDLRLAAAHRGFAPTIFDSGPERDSGEFVLDDGDSERRLQLKTVLHDAETGRWKVSKRLLRPNAAHVINFSVADPGLGGGVILAEIDADADDLRVDYLYTDFFMLSALEMRLWLEASAPARRGRPPLTRRELASRTLSELRRGTSADELWLERPLFLRARSADCLLTILGLDPLYGCPPSTLIARCLRNGFRADDDGQADAKPGYAAVKFAAHHALSTYDLLDEPGLRPFARPPLVSSG